LILVEEVVDNTDGSLTVSFDAAVTAAQWTANALRNTTQAFDSDGVVQASATSLLFDVSGLGDGGPYDGDGWAWNAVPAGVDPSQTGTITF
jgi:hypothetical protein